MNKVSIAGGAGLLIAVAIVAALGTNRSGQSSAAIVPATAAIDFSTTIRKIDPTAIGVGSSTYGANPLSSAAQSAAEQKLDARYIRIPVGYRNGRVTSSAGGGPTNLDVPALVKLYQSWGYRVLAVIGGRTNDADVQPGDATLIIRALGTGPNIDYSAPNELGNQGKTIQDEIALAKMIVAEGKLIDPNFKIWGPVWAYYDRASIKTFAVGLGQDLAGIDYHHYAMGGTSLSTAQAMSETPSFAREIAEIKADLAVLGLGDRPVNVDELNFSWRYQDGTPGGNNRFFTTVNTVWMASALGHILQAGGRGLPYATQNGPLGVMVEAGNTNPDNRAASSPMPAYWGIAAYTGGKVWPHYKDTVYSATISDASSEVVAFNNQSAGYNAVLINKSEADDKTVTLTLKGVTAGSYSVYQTNAAAPYDQPALIRQATAYAAAGTISLTMPKMSVSIIVFTPSTAASPSPTPTPVPVRLPGDANGDGRINALDLSILISNDGKNFVAADFNNDGTVGAADMAILLSKWTW